MGELLRADIWKVADLTRGQRTNELWKDLRRYRLTGSNFGKTFKGLSSCDTNIDKLRSDLFDSKDLSHIPAIQWGQAHEAEALREYQKQTHYSLKDTGLWLFDNACLGASPDSLVYEGDKLVGIVEVKCPYKLRSIKLTSEDIMGLDLPYITADNDLAKSHDYYHQVQAELYATGAPWCDFFVWSPSRTHKIRIFPDCDWKENTLPKIQEFFLNKILRPIINPRQLVLQVEFLLKNNTLEQIPISKSTFSEEEILSIERATLGQYKNPKWWLYEAGRLSSNLFHNVYRVACAYNYNPERDWVLERTMFWTHAMFNYNDHGNCKHKNGLDNEIVAIHRYETESAYQVEPSGLWLFPRSPLCATPDGLIFNQVNPSILEGILEVKVIPNWWTWNVQDKDIFYLGEDHLLRHNTQYYFQVQGHLAATNARWCDFVVWGPKYLHCERIFPNEDWISNKLPVIKTFVEGVMLPLSYTRDFWDKIMTR